MRKIILVDKPGRLGNQLWSRAFFVVVASYYSIQIIDIPFYGYAKYFKKTHPAWNNYRIYLFSKRGIGKYANKMIECVLKIFFRLHGRFLPIQQGYVKIMHLFGAYIISENISLHSLLKLTQKHHLICIFAWPFRFQNTIQEKEQGLISNFFSFPKPIKIKCYLAIKSLNSSFDILIGIHIRRADFHSYLGGKFHYSNLQYQKVIYHMEQLLHIKNPMRKVAFIICSDEKIIPKTFKRKLNGNHVFYDQRHFFEDLLLLSMCHMIIGPTSTFSMWASYIGRVPLFKIKPSKILPNSVKDFSVVTSLT